MSAALLLAGSVAAAPRAATSSPAFYLGSDLSAANEMEDCGAKFREGGRVRDVFALFAEHGTNLVRVRLWNEPSGRYSTLADVEKTIARARAQHMPVLLDFHYSDTWADGEKQIVPKAWANIRDVNQLADALHGFTYDTLRALDARGLMPDMVQVGNETNSALLGSVKGELIDWRRNAKLFNAAIRAVREAGARSAIRPRVMIHIAQPEHALPWFDAAQAAGVTGYDQIGLSYYAKWSNESFGELAWTIRELRRRFGKDVMVVETAYPWTLENADSSPNLLGKDSLVPGYPATPEGQARYLADLVRTVSAAGGNGLVYWAPDWVSTSCRTPWGVGTGWDNATFFDHAGEALPAIDFPRTPLTATASSGRLRPDTPTSRRPGAP